MERNFHGFAKIAVFSVVSLCALFLAVTANAEDKTIASRTEEVNGVRLQYLTAGRGPAVILLHGYAETSRMWKPIIPLLAERFTVIAPDLPGIGDSAIPGNGLDFWWTIPLRALNYWGPEAVLLTLSLIAIRLESVSPRRAPNARVPSLKAIVE